MNYDLLLPDGPSDLPIGSRHFGIPRNVSGGEGTRNVLIGLRDLQPRRTSGPDAELGGSHRVAIVATPYGFLKSSHRKGARFRFDVLGMRNRDLHELSVESLVSGQYRDILSKRHLIRTRLLGVYQSASSIRNTRAVFASMSSPPSIQHQTTYMNS